MDDPGTQPEPDHYDLWMQAGGHPDLYRRLSVEATETDPGPELHHEPLSEYCGVGGRPKPGHAEYRCCRCGQWYCWTGAIWAPGRPSAKWLRERGLDAGDFWDVQGDGGKPPLFSEFGGRRPTLLMVLRWLLRGKRLHGPFRGGARLRA